MQTLPKETLDEPELQVIPPWTGDFLCIHCGDPINRDIEGVRTVIYGFCSCYSTARRKRNI